MISDADKAELRRDERHAEQQEILWDEARDAAWDAAFYTRVKHICFGLKLDAKFRLHAEARSKVWEKGYCLLCDVNGTLYVYKNP